MRHGNASAADLTSGMRQEEPSPIALPNRVTRLISEPAGTSKHAPARREAA
jgi:hypothetical protein